MVEAGNGTTDTGAGHRPFKRLLILPTRNEENALPLLYEEMPDGVNVVVVDSRSTDKTADTARRLGWDCIDARHGMGQGSGIRTGFEYAVSRGYSEVFLMDADYTDDPADLARMASAVESGDLDIVLGVRDFVKQREYLGLTTVLVKKTVSILILALTGVRLRDALTGFWGFKIGAIEKIAPRLRGTGFDYGFEVVFHAWTLGLRIGETDVNFRKRKGKTKLTLVKRLMLVYSGLRYGLKVVAHRLAHFHFQHDGLL
jgi:dolichol-phosphate mannosyltransferase